MSWANGMTSTAKIRKVMCVKSTKVMHVRNRLLVSKLFPVLLWISCRRTVLKDQYMLGQSQSKRLKSHIKNCFIIFTERRHQKHHIHAMKTLKENEALFRFHTAFVLKKFVP